MLSRPEGEAGGASVLYFKVADIYEATAALLARGVAKVEDPHLIAKMDTYDLWMAFFRDSEGNMHAVMSEVGQP